ncbi:hypothetical protein [Roseivirga misakiensis]|uniref:Uncharacterized protein n=1 Tax=Roseivirga misakiensis TaxID=1563681 RepID=A0A1E5T4R9_9BACT|nr:hypothetical protein [Roseivirga misakiensis]OEK06360.1 hypothetical protein BFP71_01395 [Roseivirga misakiensis]
MITKKFLKPSTWVGLSTFLLWVLVEYFPIEISQGFIISAPSISLLFMALSEYLSSRIQEYQVKRNIKAFKEIIEQRLDEKDISEDSDKRSRLKEDLKDINSLLLLKSYRQMYDKIVDLKDEEGQTINKYFSDIKVRLDDK